MRMHRIVAVVSMVGLLGACGSPTDPKAPDQVSPTASTSSAAAGPIAYAKSWGEYGVATGSVEVRKRSDLSKLTGAPSDFVDFIGDVLSDNADPSGECDPRINVDGIDPTTGVAIGGVGGCGGADVLWIRQNGRWIQATGTQMGWTCEELEKFRVPQEIVSPTCMVYAGNESTTLHYGGPGALPKPGTPGHRMVYMTTLNADSSGADGVTIEVADDVEKLKGAPSRFVDLMEAEQLTRDCDTMVYGIDPKAGIATGSKIRCDNSDGFQVIWMLWNNSWIDVAANAGRWPCDVLKQYRVPDDLTGSTCSEWNNNGDESVVGYDGPEA